MVMKIGYARVSTADQHLRMQEDALKNAGCEEIYTDVISGIKSKRPGLEETLSRLREGDTLIGLAGANEQKVTVSNFI